MEKRGLLTGITYGLIPHIGCIAFIVASILGITTATAFFKPLLLNSYFFYGLIVLSLAFATISAIIYLKKNGILSTLGAKRKWKYLSVLYGTTIGINLFLFMFVFPYTANLIPRPAISGSFTNEFSQQSMITLQVDIPCSGHAPLITDELYKLEGIAKVNFRSPNLFDISYDKTQTSKEDIINLDIFNTYKAKIVN